MDNQEVITLQELVQLYNEEALQFLNNGYEQNFEELKLLIDKLIIAMNNYLNGTKHINELIKQQSTSVQDKLRYQQIKLDIQLKTIYEDFFKLQNLMNFIIHQKILMTYVHVDEEGKREIRIFDNNIEQIKLGSYKNPYNGKENEKLEYEVNEFKTLINDNIVNDKYVAQLQNITSEVENRYETYNGKILWKFKNQWYGYRLYNRGPINEAYVSYYLHEVKWSNIFLYDLNRFMMSNNPQGVVRADNANGFLVGDIHYENLQFAVKGIGGGPQSFTKIINALKHIQDSGFTYDSFKWFINKFTEEEIKKATPLVKELTNKSIAAMIRYHGDKLLEKTEKPQSNV